MIASFAAKTFTTRDRASSAAESQTYRGKRKNSSSNNPPKKFRKGINKNTNKHSDTDEYGNNLKSTRMSRFSISTPEDMLQSVQNRDDMKQWIAKYKLKNDLISKAFTCCNKEYQEDSVKYYYFSILCSL